MAHHHLSFPLQAPGDRAGEVFAELEQRLGGHVGLGADHIVTVAVDAETIEEARAEVVDAISAVHAEGYFDLSEIRPPMAVSVRRYQVGAGEADELGRRVAEGFAHIIAEAAGFIAYHLVRSADREITSIKIFADRASLEGSDELTREWERENLGQFRLSSPQSAEGDVLVSRRAR